MEAVQIAKSILAADGQPFVILSLAQGFAPVTPETPLPVARRSYMRLAGVIHPDRLKGSFDKATEAFQCLVSAFECFADPKARKQAAAAAQGKSKAESRASTAADGRKAKAAPPSSTTSRPSASQQMKKANSKAAAAPAASVADEKAWEALAAANTEPEVSTNRTPIGQPRLGGLYQHTTVGCPKCRSLWEPDSRPQYSLFMGQWGKKVHCQLCLFQFGCATALHGCPHCSAPFDYDASMYDTVQTCQRCKRQFGFPYYPVSQHLIDQIALEEWRERMERQKTSEREARARARHGGGGRDEATATEKMQLLVGTCIMEEECPLCHKRVKSKHRAHVEECMATPPGELATSAGRASRKTTRAAPPADKVAKAPASRTAKTTPKANPKTTTPGATKKSAKRKRQRSDSDFSEGEDSLSDSEEDAISSESSFSYSDYDDSD
ncbi:DnaJ domain family protein [Leishmania donovani]|uniref:DnaJ domain family protein n=1 Tax=Leishmania donovani TaxID=5661 RepID=A0A504XUE7_LEIDO|nr:DnaJ domain family protein [Leishmania donovani]